MAATTAFSSLPVPAADDTMEMSSPAHPLGDDDIDLDFDADFGGGVQLPDDERMLTDGEPSRPPTATDELMEDDAHAQIQEAMMDDDTPVTQHPVDDDDHDDLELIDYEDEEVELTQHAEAQSTIPNIAAADFASREHPPAPDKQADGEITRVLGHVGLDGQSPTLPLDRVHEAQPNELLAAPLELEDYPNEITRVSQEQPFIAADDEEQVTAPADDTDLTVLNDYDSEDVQSDTFDPEAENPPATVDASLQTSIDGPATPTDTGLHAMTLYYGEHVMPLFKSKTQSDGLLKDDNLANLSLNELVRNCRHRLALKIGNIPEEKELFLSFDQLNLLLFGNSDAAFEHSLNDVLEVYMQLHQNDGAQEIPPLSLTLSSNQFTSQLSGLKQAAALGHGMSAYLAQIEDEGQQSYGEGGEGDELAWVPSDENAQDEQYREDAEHGGYAEDHLEHPYDAQDHPNTEDLGDPGSDDRQEAAEDGLNQTPRVEQYEALEAHHEDGQEYTFSDPAASSAEAAPTEHEPAQNNAPSVDPSARLQQSANNDAKKAESEASSATLDGDKADPRTGEYVKEELVDYDDDDGPASLKSELHDSATLDGNKANESTGEYNEGLIDWDDDNLTHVGSESHGSATVQRHKVDTSAGEYIDEDLIDLDDDLMNFGSEPHDATFDGSTLAAEYETEEAKNKEEHAAEQTGPEGLPGSNELKFTTTSSQGATGAGDLTEHVDYHEQLGSDAFLNEDDDAQYDDATVGDEEVLEGHQDFAYEEQYQEQTDTFQEQQEEEDDDGHGGEDEEQYHTAHDFLNGAENYDTGLEYNLEPGSQGDEETYTGEDPLQFDGEKHQAEENFDQQPSEDESHQQDEIGFDDDVAAPAPAPPTTAQHGTGSPLGKRSFDKHVELELVFEDDEPELKKARSE